MLQKYHVCHLKYHVCHLTGFFETRLVYFIMYRNFFLAFFRRCKAREHESASGKKRFNRRAAGMLNPQKKISSFFSFFKPSHLLSSPFLSCSVLVVTQIRSHIVSSFPPSSPRYVPCVFIAKRIKHFLPSSTRVELCLPTL